MVSGVLTTGGILYNIPYTRLIYWPWYFTLWGAVFTLIFEVGINLMYLSSSYGSLYDEMIGYLFEILMPMEFVITLVYWVFLYHSGSIDLKYPQTLLGTFFLHGGLLISLTIEWMFNSRVFNLVRTLTYFLYI